jgi:hypothetical protein
LNARPDPPLAIQFDRVANMQAEMRSIDDSLAASKSSTDGDDIQPRPDSGYGSIQTSPRRSLAHDSEPPTKETNVAGTPVKFAGPGKKSTVDGMFSFNKTVDKATISRFNEIVPQIERLLVANLRESRPFLRPRQLGPMAIRLMVLGTDDGDPSEYMVVLCQPDHVKCIQQFFNSSLIKSLYEPPDDLVPRFKVLISGTAPQLRSGGPELDVTALYDQSAKGRKTLCGIPIYLVSNSSNIRGKSTIGGLIKVTFGDGKEEIYGMIAGHILEEIRERQQGKASQDSLGKQEDEPERPLHDSGLLMENSPDPPLPHSGQDMGDAWNLKIGEWEGLGKVLDPCALPSIRDEVKTEKQPCRDWALFETKSCNQKLLPNQMCIREPSGMLRRKQFLSAAKLSFEHDQQVAVFMIATHGPTTGNLSALPSRILLGEEFVDSYTMSLDEYICKTSVLSNQ